MTQLRYNRLLKSKNRFRKVFQFLQKAETIALSCQGTRFCFPTIIMKTNNLKCCLALIMSTCKSTLLRGRTPTYSTFLNYVRLKTIAKKHSLKPLIWLKMKTWSPQKTQSSKIWITESNQRVTMDATTICCSQTFRQRSAKLQNRWQGMSKLQEVSSEYSRNNRWLMLILLVSFLTSKHRINRSCKAALDKKR